MKRYLARLLRAAARRLDPPAPLTIQIYGTANTVSDAIYWRLGGN